nr:EOG090X08JJ [Eulimnadia texana]
MSKRKAVSFNDEDDDLIGIDPEGSDKEDEKDESRHYQLLNEISKIGGKKRSFVPQRTEASRVISEFSLTTTKVDEDDNRGAVVKVDDLLNAISKKHKVADLKKSLKTAEKRAKTLDAPLEKPQAQQVQRVTAYEKVTEEVGKWDPVVKKNRRAEQLVFPLNRNPVRIQTAEESAATFVPRTPLEQQIAEILHGSKHVQKKGEELTEAEKEALSSMSLKEALERRKELSRMRALQSYQEAKARRQNKIKSKKYHRLLKRERLRKEMQDFESLQRTDPEAALEKLEQLEKIRVEERMTLRHKGTGKWAKLQAIRSKYDNEAREALADQLRLGKELTQKARKAEESEDEDLGEVLENTDQQQNEDNPWLSDGITSGYRKYWNERNKLTAEKKKSDENQEEEAEKDYENEEEEEGDDENVEEEEEEGEKSDVEDYGADHSAPLAEGLERKTQLADYENMEAGEERGEEEVEEGTDSKQQKQKAKKQQKKEKSKQRKTEKEKSAAKSDVSIDPQNFIGVQSTVVRSSIPNIMNVNEEDEQEESADIQSHRMTLAEAFADDDVIEEMGRMGRNWTQGTANLNIIILIIKIYSKSGVPIAPMDESVLAQMKKSDDSSNILLTLMVNRQRQVVNQKMHLKSHQAQEKVQELPAEQTLLNEFETILDEPFQTTKVTSDAFKRLISFYQKRKSNKSIAPIKRCGLLPDTND